MDSYFCEVIFSALYENEMEKITENVMLYELLFFLKLNSKPLRNVTQRNISLILNRKEKVHTYFFD